MIFFTSDELFGSENAVRTNKRPYDDATEMCVDMFIKWNTRVGKNDTVYILGDLFAREKNAEDILRRLHGHKHLIIGNHDKCWMDTVPLYKYFESVNEYLEINLDLNSIVMSHYPMYEWNKYGISYMVHGHIKLKTEGDYFRIWCNNPCILNAGVDINGFMPVTFDELISNNSAYKNDWLARHPN